VLSCGEAILVRRDLVLRRSRVAGQDIHCGLGTIVTTDMRMNQRCFRWRGGYWKGVLNELYVRNGFNHVFMVIEVTKRKLQ
jgi:hypothetical protein